MTTPTTLEIRRQLVASPDGRDGSMRINQDTTLRIADLQPGDTPLGVAANDDSQLLWFDLA